MAKKKKKAKKAKHAKAKAKKVLPIPKGFHTVTPYITVHGAAELINFVKKAFDAKVAEIHTTPDGIARHALVKIGDSMVMIAESNEGAPPPESIHLYLYVKDTDKYYRQAMAAGATSLMAPADQFYGDRNAGVKDASGCSWWIATHIEDMSKKELDRRMEEAMKKRAAQTKA